MLFDASMEVSFGRRLHIWCWRGARERIRGRGYLYMPVSGESIRLMNYVDDISTTLRRIHALTPMLAAEEKQKLAAYMKDAKVGYDELVAGLTPKS